MTDRERSRDVRVVRNKDIPILAQVLSTMQLVCSLEGRCQWQRDRLYNITRWITGMPRSKSPPQGLDAAFAAIDDTNAAHGKQIAQYLHELKVAERIVNGIESRTMRAFVVLMYIEGLPPEQVREELNLTEWGFRRARESIEQAEDMKSVVWREKYIIAGH
jgi:hypothetical protein